ncbi:MAG: threonine/serine exporter ThrE family protein [Eubacteriales bacterium]
MEQKTNIASAIPADDVLFISLELGEHILRSGGEISRAEDTITRICKAYGAVHVDVTAIWSMIALTVDFDDTRSTCTRRITDSTSTNLDRLSKLNNLSRYICANLPTKEEVVAEMKNINAETKIKLPRFILGNMIGTAGFAVFFSDFSHGITSEILLIALLDGILAGLISLPICLLANYLSRTRTNPVIAKFVVCFLGGLSAILVGKLIVPCHADIIMIGNIMSFIPGVAMTNSFRDLFGGDIMSGIFRLCTALIDAVAIAVGYAVAILILGGAV